MTGRIVFIDTETTSLRPDRRAWEVGLIVRKDVKVRHPDGPDTIEPCDEEYRWFVHSEDLDLGNADPFALKIGRFYERHPDYCDHKAAEGCVPEAHVLMAVEKLTRGAHLAGAVVNFDADVLGTRMRAHGILPSWHYHLIEIEALACGYLAGKGHPLDHQGDPEGKTARMFDPRVLPWQSDALFAALGVSIRDEDRHTALGDARGVRDAYDVIMGAAA